MTRKRSRYAIHHVSIAAAAMHSGGERRYVLMALCRLGARGLVSVEREADEQVMSRFLLAAVKIAPMPASVLIQDGQRYVDDRFATMWESAKARREVGLQLRVSLVAACQQCHIDHREI